MYSPHAEGVQVRHHLVTVVPLVGDDVEVARRVQADRRFELFRGHHQRRLNRLRVAGIRPLDRHRDDRPAFQIDGVLRFVRQMRASVFHLRDRCVWVLRMLPVVVRALLLPLLVDLRQVFSGRRRNPRRLSQLRQELLVRVPRVAAHDAAQRRVGLQRRAVDSQRPAAHQSPLDQPLLDPREHGPVRLHINQPARPRDRRVVGHVLIQPHTQEPADGERVGCPPCDPALRIQAFEVADQQQPEVDPRRQARPSHRRRVERAARLLHERIEARVVQEDIQPLVERVRRRARQLGHRDPQALLSAPFASRAHRHGRQCSTRDRSCRSPYCLSMTNPVTCTTGC